MNWQAERMTYAESGVRLLSKLSSHHWRPAVEKNRARQHPRQATEKGTSRGTYIGAEEQVHKEDVTRQCGIEGSSDTKSEKEKRRSNSDNNK